MLTVNCAEAAATKSAVAKITDFIVADVGNDERCGYVNTALGKGKKRR